MAEIHVPKLELADVHKSYGDKRVLNGIDLQVDDHEVVCLIGPSGCGKSTLLRCVDLLDPIDAGAIRLDGADITARGVDANAVRRRIGIVFQSYNLIAQLNVLENILVPLLYQDDPPPDGEERARALAERVLTERESDAARVERGFMLVLGRPPSPAETEVLVAAAVRERRAFATDPDAATALLAVGEAPRNDTLDAVEHAAWTVVASTLLNLEEAITRS